MEKIEISHRTIIFAILFLVFAWFIYAIREILILLFVSIIMMFALNPLVSSMERFKIPRQLAILLIYLIIFGALIGLVASLIPVFINQTSLLFDNLPKLVQGLTIFGVEIRPSDFGQELMRLPMNAFKIVAATFSNLLGLFVFAVFTFYLLMERKNLPKYLSAIIKVESEKHTSDLIDRIETKVGGWVRGELLLMLIVGLLSYIGLTLLDIEFALPLAVISGLLEAVTNIGPVIATIPAALVGLSVSPIMSITVVMLYTLIQQLENNLIVPKVMQKAAGLHPLVTLSAIMIGLKLDGALGAVIALPFFLMIQVIVKEIYDHRLKEKNKKA